MLAVDYFFTYPCVVHQNKKKSEVQNFTYTFLGYQKFYFIKVMTLLDKNCTSLLIMIQSTQSTWAPKFNPIYVGLTKIQPNILGPTKNNPIYMGPTKNQPNKCEAHHNLIRFPWAHWNQPIIHGAHRIQPSLHGTHKKINPIATHQKSTRSTWDPPKFTPNLHRTHQ